MDESRVNFRVQELGPAITLVMRIGYLKWLSLLCDRVLKRIPCSIYIDYISILGAAADIFVFQLEIAISQVLKPELP
jgi:hypothetical protein